MKAPEAAAPATGGGETGRPPVPLWGTKLPLAAVVAISAVFWSAGRDLDVGSLTQPGPGFWPLVLTVALAVTALLGLAIDTEAGTERFGAESWRVGVGVVVLYLFIVLFSYAGVILPGILLVMFWLKVLARESWKVAVGVGVVGTLLSYLLFVVALGVALPDDLIAQLWGGR
ncbi:tripartite tricarboxylate transporter TctB family protein [Pseudonocardia kunmingensis]|uniref:Tripartite tricarboxylate transporter TctB family protein n=1 Tax=Pseudonocardia kunmingensis TaxID=630975 RepID=A0A543D0B2_9PSEU|nr:tripartite tricarboxylate transporter TctB family protein [Pseudonocardia kunmingensis]TQM02803.1 tripartite tricarboxylate transporter TctB family protein [Pseudonocardia kunmingensis]